MTCILHERKREMSTARAWIECQRHEAWCWGWSALWLRFYWWLICVRECKKIGRRKKAKGGIKWWEPTITCLGVLADYRENYKVCRNWTFFRTWKRTGCEVIMVEELARRRAPLFRGSGWETRPGLAVAFPSNQNKVSFGPWLLVLWGAKQILVGRPDLARLLPFLPLKTRWDFGCWLVIR